MHTAANCRKMGVISRLHGRLRRLVGSVRFLMTASGVSFICVVSALIGYGVWQQREGAVTRTGEHAGELADLLEVQTRQSLRQAERLSSDLATLLRIYDDLPPAQRFDLQSYLRQHADAFPQIANILLIDPDGGVRLRAREQAPRSEAGLSIRDLVQPHLQRRDFGLTIGAPVPAQFRSPGSAIPATRRLEAGDGRLSGVLLLLLDPDYLHRLFAERLPSRDDAATLLSADGKVVIAQPEERPALQTHIGEWDELANAVARAAEPGRSQSAQFRLSRHGVDYAVGYKRLDGYGFSVLAFYNLNAALSDWRRDAMAWTAIGLAMTLAIGVLTWYVVRQHERRETDQAQLLEASHRIRGILDSMMDAVVTIDGRGWVQTFNPAAERLFGYREHDIIGQSINLLVPQQHHHHHRGIDPAAASANDGQRIIGADREILALRRDGTTFPVTLAVSSLLTGAQDAAPERNTFVGVIRDITKRKQYEAELLASKSAAELANRSKSEFLANMSHELRTPLNAVIGFAEILDSEFFGKLNERQKACAKDIHDSGAHLLEIVNAILDMSKIETGHYELNEEAIDPAEAVSQCLLMVRDRAEENGVVIVNHIDTALPSIWADRRAYRQVILNLLSNAVKFTPAEGRVEIDAGLADSGLAVRVSDTGIGIPEDFKPLLYQPFRQADNSASRQYEGVGLGLSIAKNLLELHGGTLLCDSREGVGSTFTAIIPQNRLISPPGSFKAND